MINITLLVIPGRNIQPITLTRGSTLADLIALHPNLAKQSWGINKDMIKPKYYANTIINDGAEVCVFKPVKGSGPLPIIWNTVYAEARDRLSRNA